MSTQSNSYRIVKHDRFDATGITNEVTLANALLTKPDVINPVLTHLAGREDLKFPLTFMTEGQKGGTRTIELNDVQYTWPVIKRTRLSDAIVSTGYVSGDKPGLAGAYVTVIFETAWLKVQHTIVSPSGVRCRIQRRPEKVGANFRYRIMMNNPTNTSFIPLADLQPGVRWSMTGGASVSESLSMGNESNVMTPGEMKNQITFLRKSYHWAGNAKNKVVECQFTVNGKQTNLFMDFERWQHTMFWKQVCEESYWEDQYNRNALGVITLTDEDSNLPIPNGAGVIDQIPNTDTYSILTSTKIKNTVGDVFYGNTDTGNMNVILYTGFGGAEEFDNAMKEDAKNFQTINADKFIMGTGRSLMLGGFFTTYQHIDGHTVTVRKLNLLDFGGRAENAPKHPKSGKPMTSYEMYFLDQSSYDGENNITMVTQRGRAMLTGLHKGMSPVPDELTGTGSEFIATEQDKSSIHFLSAKGICIRRNNTCFKLTCDILG